MVIGTLLALSEQSLAKTVIAALFASFGGSVILLMEKLTGKNQLNAVLAILMVSTGTILGTYSGLYVNEHELLTPPTRRATRASSENQAPCPRKYLRENALSRAAAIDTQYRTGSTSRGPGARAARLCGVVAALSLHRDYLRLSEVGLEPRHGFCYQR